MEQTYSIYHTGGEEIIGPFDSFSLAEDFFYRLAQYATTMYYLIDNSTGKFFSILKKLRLDIWA